MIILARFFDWRDALVIVKPETVIKWHRKAFPIILALEITHGWWPSITSYEHPEPRPPDGP